MAGEKADIPLGDYVPCCRSVSEESVAFPQMNP
jgi:hypothetical protein